MKLSLDNVITLLTHVVGIQLALGFWRWLFRAMEWQ